EGWSSALRRSYGQDAVIFIEESGILDEQIEDVPTLVKLMSRTSQNGHPFSTEVLSDSAKEIVIKAIENQSGLAQTHRIPGDLLEAHEYRQLVRVHAQLVETAGTPPFSVALGEHAGQALTFGELREQVLDLARRGVDVNRFKGLGEMNPAQLRDTTMDPSRRTLVQVTVEDAAQADKIFSMLMGDHVEPRRQFIEENARLVTNLDV